MRVVLVISCLLFANAILANPLHDAIRKGLIAPIIQLVMQGADVDELDDEGNSARALAAKLGNRLVIEALDRVIEQRLRYRLGEVPRSQCTTTTKPCGPARPPVTQQTRPQAMPCRRQVVMEGAEDIVIKTGKHVKTMREGETNQLSRGVFFTQWKSPHLLIIDSRTNQVVKTVVLGEHPDGVYVANLLVAGEEDFYVTANPDDFAPKEDHNNNSGSNHTDNQNAADPFVRSLMHFGSS